MTKSDTSIKGGASDTRSKGKVAKLIHKYEIDDLGDELVEYWTREDDDRMSLRELTEYFNRTLVAQTLEHEGNNPLDGEIENYYRILTSDDVSSGTRIEAENKLRQDGVNVDQLHSDFVSRQAIHTYLKSDRDVTYTPPRSSEEERLNNRIESIGRLKSRLSTIASNAVAELTDIDNRSNSDVRISVLVQAQCEQCGTRHTISEFLANGGCGCNQGGK